MLSIDKNLTQIQEMSDFHQEFRPKFCKLDNTRWWFPNSERRKSAHSLGDQQIETDFKNLHIPTKAGNSKELM